MTWAIMYVYKNWEEEHVGNDVYRAVWEKGLWQRITNKKQAQEIADANLSKDLILWVTRDNNERNKVPQAVKKLVGTGVIL